MRPTSLFRRVYHPIISNAFHNYNITSAIVNRRFLSTALNTKETDIKHIINEQYSNTARNFDKILDKSQQQKIQSIAKVFGYSDKELLEIGQANMGLSCGNPVRQANIKQGETVLDLGCGAGMDMFLAQKYVGDNGMVLGVDMSKDMIEKAKTNAQNRSNTADNMKFYLSEIENMSESLHKYSVDCVISNCVLNLVPNKYNAFKEIYKVLKPDGGRICLSDIALKQALPSFIANDINKYVGCIGGAILVDEYINLLYKAGFKEVQVVDKNVDMNVWKQTEFEEMIMNKDGTNEVQGCCIFPEKTESNSCCGSNGQNEKESGSDLNSQKYNEMDLNDYIASYYVFGFK